MHYQFNLAGSINRTSHDHNKIMGESFTAILSKYDKAYFNFYDPTSYYLLSFNNTDVCIEYIANYTMKKYNGGGLLGMISYGKSNITVQIPNVSSEYVKLKWSKFFGNSKSNEICITNYPFMHSGKQFLKTNYYLIPNTNDSKLIEYYNDESIKKQIDNPYFIYSGNMIPRKFVTQMPKENGINITVALKEIISNKPFIIRYPATTLNVVEPDKSLGYNYISERFILDLITEHTFLSIIQYTISLLLIFAIMYVMNLSCETRNRYSDQSHLSIL